MTDRLWSLTGIAAFLLLAWVLSVDRRRFPWRAVVWGLGLQAGFAALILKTTPGHRIFDGFQSAVNRLVSFASEGNELVFGPLASDEILTRGFGPGNTVILAITITGTIILVSTVSAVLYHYGILQHVVRGMAWIMRRAMGTSGSETLATAANIFMGQTEAPLMIRPYLPRMTQSELFCMMTGGFATIAGTVIGVYTGVLKIPAGSLLTASVMSAPAALLISKIMFPERESSDTAAGASAEVERTTVNGLDAVCRGAADGMMLSINVAAMLLAFTSLVALANFLVAWVVGFAGWTTEKPIQEILGLLNAPFAVLMGVPFQDARVIGQILGERIVLNEFIGYISLSKAQATLTPRAYDLTVYALCGFANFASIAIQIGGIGALAPERRSDLARLGFRAMIAGLLACYLTACVAGILT